MKKIFFTVLAVFIISLSLFGCTTQSFYDLKGRVVDEKNKPVKNITVDLNLYINDEYGYVQYATATTDKNGKYVFNKIDPGKMIVIAQDNKNKLSGAVGIEVKEAFKTTAAPDIKIASSNTFWGDVYENATQKPLSSAIVKIKIEKWGNIELSKAASSGGKVEFKLIPEGNYEPVASKNGYEENRAKITIQKGNTTQHNFYLIKKSESVKATSEASDSKKSSFNANSSSNASSSDSNSTGNTSNESESGNNNNNNTQQDDTYNVKTETINLGGHNMTVYRPDNDGEYPGVLSINIFSGENLAKYGYYVVAGEPENTEAAGAIIDAMKASQYCSNKVGITGFSWAGAMSMEIAAKTKKASAVFEMAGLLVPENNINLATDMPNPVYFVTGENDELAPPTQVRAMYDQLRSGGQSAEIYIVPGEGHGYSDSAMNTLFSKALGFFNSYLH